MNKTQNLAIIGAGAWGSALAGLAKREGHQVRVWSRRNSEKIESVVENADVVLSAVASKGIRPTIDKLKKLDLPPILVTATKGLDPDTTRTPSQLWQEAFPNRSIVVLSGPNLSKEINQGLPAATVVASEDEKAAQTVQSIFNCESFRVYLNNDPLGTELGGTLKNVIAIAAGVCDGLQLGTNAKSGLLTRALPEMVRVGTSLGACAETFFGLSGLGDLLATCSSSLSRNYQVGYGLAQGKSVEQSLSEIEGTAEGINTTNVLIEIAKKYDITVPIAEQVYRLIRGEETSQDAVKALMEREPKPEFKNFF